LTVLVLGRLLAARLAVLAIAPAAATAAPAPLAERIAVAAILARFARGLAPEFGTGNRLVVFFFFDERGEAGDRGRPRAGAGDAHLGAFLLALGQHLDLDAVALFDLRKVGALGVEQVHRGLGRGVERDRRALALGRLVLDQPQRREPGARGRAHETGAVAVRAGAGGRFEHAGAQPLAAHFHQPEAGNAADLDARAVVLERLLHRLLDLPDVRSVLHVDEVDDDEPGHVAQAQLAGDLARRLEVGVERGRLDAVLLGRAARVDVDRDQRLGRVDHQVAAALELHHRVVHRRELVLGAVALEQRHRV